MWEIFGEAEVPLIAGQTFAEVLTVGAAGRFSQYSNIGDTFTWQANNEDDILYFIGFPNFLSYRAARMKLDRIDFDIVTMLQKNARISNKDLAAANGISASTCLERVRRLNRIGVIRGYHAAVAPAARPWNAATS